MRICHIPIFSCLVINRLRSALKIVTSGYSSIYASAITLFHNENFLDLNPYQCGCAASIVEKAGLSIATPIYKPSDRIAAYEMMEAMMDMARDSDRFSLY